MFGKGVLSSRQEMNISGTDSRICAPGSAWCGGEDVKCIRKSLALQKNPRPVKKTDDKSHGTRPPLDLILRSRPMGRIPPVQRRSVKLL